MDASRIRIHVLATGVIFVILMIPTSFVEGYSGLIAADPSNPGKCIYRSEEIKLGVSAGPLPCQRLTCHENGSVLVEGCGKIRIPNCNRGERINVDKAYPDCCKQRFKCKRPDGSSYYEERDIL